MPRLALALAALAALPGLSGCLACTPTLDVRHCRDAAGRCAPNPGDRTLDWDPALADVWPDLARLLESTPRGEHGHADWTPQQEQAFWRFWDVPLDREAKQVFLRHDGGLYRVRVLSC